MFTFIIRHFISFLLRILCSLFFRLLFLFAITATSISFGFLSTYNIQTSDWIPKLQRPWFIDFQNYSTYGVCFNFKFVQSVFSFWYYYYSLLPFEFFIPASADDSSWESAWQQVSTNFQDFSQYSGRSHECWSLDGLNSSSYFQALIPILWCQEHQLQLISPSLLCSIVFSIP